MSGKVWLMAIVILFSGAPSWAATPLIAGVNTILSSSDAGNATFMLAGKAQLAQAATINSLSVYVKTPSGQMRLAIYNDNGGKPGALIAQTNAFATAYGWNTAAVLQPVAMQPGSYWLAFEADNNTVSVAGTYSGGAYVYRSGWSFQPYPANFPPISGSGAWRFSLYASLTPSTSPSPTPTPAPTATPTKNLTIGVKSVLGSSDANNQTFVLASKVQLAQSARVSSISAYIKKAAGNMRFAVYADNNSRPGALMAQTNSFATLNGWNTAAVTNSSPILNPGYYWLAFESDNNTVSIAGAPSGGSYVYRSNWTYQPYPATFPAISGSGPWSFSIYASLLSATNPSPTPTPTPTATPTPIPTATPTPVAGSISIPLNDGNPSGPMVIVERLENSPQNQKAHMHMGYSTEPRPAPGGSITVPGSRFPLTMIASYESDPTINFGGTGLDRGYIPGYSRYPCVSPDGKYAIAYSTQGGISTVWDLATLKRVRYVQINVAGRLYDLGETQQLRWDYSQPTKHVLVGVYRNLGLVYLDVDNPTDQGLLPNTPRDVSGDDHQGSAERYIAFQTATYKGLYDLKTRTVSNFKWPVGADLTLPDVYRNWARVERCPPGSNSVNYFYNLDNDTLTTDSVLTLTGTHGHEAWCLDSKGNPCWFYQDNRTDGYMMYSPVEKKTQWVIGMDQLGYPNYHPTSMWSENTRGWMLISTYDPDDYATQWTANQWMLIQLDAPHVVARLGHNQTMSFLNGTEVKKYFAEAHTSIGPDGTSIWVGTNLHRDAPSTIPLLALMRLELGPNYFSRLNLAAIQLMASP